MTSEYRMNLEKKLKQLSLLFMNRTRCMILLKLLPSFIFWSNFFEYVSESVIHYHLYTVINTCLCTTVRRANKKHTSLD